MLTVNALFQRFDADQQGFIGNLAESPLHEVDCRQQGQIGTGIPIYIFI